MTESTYSLSQLAPLIPEMSLSFLQATASRRLAAHGFPAGSGNYRRYGLAHVALFRFCADNTADARLYSHATLLGGEGRYAVETAILDPANYGHEYIGIQIGRFEVQYRPRWVTADELAAVGLAETVSA